MNSKKDVLVASLVAIALAAGLGTISYGLFAQAPPNVRIDVSFKKNGATSISFLPPDQVSLEAQLSHDDASIAGAPVTFEVKMPNNTEFLSQAVQTDSHGIANLTFQIPWPSSDSLGAWQASASSEAYAQFVNATAYFDCELIPPTIDVYTQKGGQGQNTPSGAFALNETVVLYAELRNSTGQPVQGNDVSFEVKYHSTTSTIWTTTVQRTNASGIAETSTRLPSDASYAGTWEVYATAQFEDTLLIDTLTFAAQQQ
jgi:uncharacterized protein YfaS (alpha-2-macroglobulin family)